jgi:hypothetical protein
MSQQNQQAANNTHSDETPIEGPGGTGGCDGGSFSKQAVGRGPDSPFLVCLVRRLVPGRFVRRQDGGRALELPQRSTFQLLAVPQ